MRDCRPLRELRFSLKTKKQKNKKHFFSALADREDLLQLTHFSQIFLSYVNLREHQKAMTLGGCGIKRGHKTVMK